MVLGELNSANNAALAKQTLRNFYFVSLKPNEQFATTFIVMITMLLC